MVDALNTLAGIAVPLALLLYIWRTDNIYVGATMSVCACVVSILGSSKILPLLGHTVIGSSLYFPFFIITFSWFVYRFGEKRGRELRAGLMSACALVIFGIGGWLAFSIHDPLANPATVTAQWELFVNATVIIFKVYFVTVLVLFSARAQGYSDYVRFGAPTIFAAFVTTPLSVAMVLLDAPSGNLDEASLFVATAMLRIVLRIVLPLCFMALLFVKGPRDEIYRR